MGSIQQYPNPKQYASLSCLFVGRQFILEYVALVLVLVSKMLFFVCIVAMAITGTTIVAIVMVHVGLATIASVPMNCQWYH